MKNKKNYTGWAVIILILLILWYFKDWLKTIYAKGINGSWGGSGAKLTDQQMNEIAIGLIDSYGWTQDNEKKFLSEVSKVEFRDDFSRIVALVDFKLQDNVLSFLVPNYASLLSIVIDNTGDTATYNDLLQKMK